MTKQKAYWFFGLLVTYCVMIANNIVVVLRTSSLFINYSIMLVVFFIPLALLILAISIKKNFIKWAVIVGILPVLLLSAVSGVFVTFSWKTILTTGRDLSFEPVKSIQTQDFQVVIYRANGGTTTSFEIIGRQEKSILPGLLLVREIYHAYPGYDAELTIVAPNTIKIVSPPYLKKRPKPFEKVVKLRPWVYF
jgi:hypothetical protein